MAARWRVTFKLPAQTYAMLQCWCGGCDAGDRRFAFRPTWAVIERFSSLGLADLEDANRLGELSGALGQRRSLRRIRQVLS